MHEVMQSVVESIRVAYDDLRDIMDDENEKLG